MKDNKIDIMCNKCGDKLVNFFYEDGSGANKNALVCLGCKTAIEFDGESIIKKNVEFKDSR